MPKVIDETAIFKAALEMFIRHGYEGATTRKIADVAGVNEVTLFRKFGSKARLFEKAIENQLASTPLDRPEYTGDLEADLVRIIEAYIETNEEYGELIPVLLVEMHRNPDLQDAFDQPWANIQGIVRIIQRYQENGRLAGEHPLLCLSALIGPVMIAQMFRRTSPALQVPDLDAGTLVDRFLIGRRAGAPAAE